MSLSFKPPFIGEFSFLPRLITRGCVYGGGSPMGPMGPMGLGGDSRWFRVGSLMMSPWVTQD